MGLLLGVICIPAVSGTMRHKYIVWGVRVAALVVAILALGLTTKNFCETQQDAECGQAADTCHRHGRSSAYPFEAD
jgi:hypothetical protein